VDASGLRDKQPIALAVGMKVFRARGYGQSLDDLQEIAIESTLRPLTRNTSFLYSGHSLFDLLVSEAPRKIAV